MRIRVFVTIAALATCAIALAPPAGAVLPPSGPVIGIEHFAFGERTLTVPVGTTVTWVNHDEEPHTVTSAERLFASPGLDAGESFSLSPCGPSIRRGAGSPTTPSRRSATSGASGPSPC
jgi:plastocyanin